MDSKSTLCNRFKAQVNKFSGIISKGLSKPTRGFISEMIYGIQKSKDIKLSNVSRALAESIALIKTEDRLSRNMSSRDLSNHINEILCRLASNKLKDDDVIAIDPGDISKPYAKEMEGLCAIWDGDKQSKATGYHLCQIVIANTEHTKVIPTYSHVWSSKEDCYMDKHNELFKAIDTLTKYVGNKGIWAIDREGDDNVIIQKFIDDQKKFVTRLKYNRLIFLGKQVYKMQNFVQQVETPFSAKLINHDEDAKKEIQINYGAVRIKLNGIKEQLTALVVKGFGENPMVLITNLDLSVFDADETFSILKIYLTRWKCDETYRYIKQAYNLEDVRVRSLNGIKNTVALVMAVAYFAMIYMGEGLKLRVMREKLFILSKRFFAVPIFFCYAMADGIYNLLKSSDKPFTKIKQCFENETFQLKFDFD